MRHAITASRTTPTLWVLVIITGPSRKPESSTQVVPVISPLPLSVNQPANTESSEFLPRGRMAVTPVRTGPTPTFRRAAARNQRRVADFHALHVGDGIERAGSAVEGNAQVSGAWFGLGRGGGQKR